MGEHRGSPLQFFLCSLEERGVGTDLKSVRDGRRPGFVAPTFRSANDLKPVCRAKARRYAALSTSYKAGAVAGWTWRSISEALPERRDTSRS